MGPLLPTHPPTHPPPPSYIVTNYHVIRSAESAQVTLTDRQGKQSTYKAMLRGFDADKDVAVLRVRNVPPTHPLTAFYRDMTHPPTHPPTHPHHPFIPPSY